MGDFFLINLINVKEGKIFENFKIVEILFIITIINFL